MLLGFLCHFLQSHLCLACAVITPIDAIVQRWLHNQFAPLNMHHFCSFDYWLYNLILDDSQLTLPVIDYKMTLATYIHVCTM